MLDSVLCLSIAGEWDSDLELRKFLYYWRRGDCLVRSLQLEICARKSGQWNGRGSTQLTSYFIQEAQKCSIWGGNICSNPCDLYYVIIQTCGCSAIAGRQNGKEWAWAPNKLYLWALEFLFLIILCTMHVFVIIYNFKMSQEKFVPRLCRFVS